jgi:aquaporin Z
VTLLLLVGIPVTGASLNPARSTGPALFVGGWALEQLWLFGLAPIVGGVLGGLLYRGLVPGAAAEALQLAEAGRGLRLAAQSETHRQLVTH